MAETFKFNSKRSRFKSIFGILWLVCALVMAWVWINEGFVFKNDWPQPLILLLSFKILLSAYKTSYSVEGKFLKSKSWDVRHEIDINTIFQIEKTTAYLKPGFYTSRKGLLIKYNKYDEFFVSPTDPEAFIESLLKVNPRIDII